MLPLVSSVTSGVNEANRGNFDEFKPRLMAFLRGLPVIRVYMDNSPNFGHQANTIAIMRRLKALGFEGVFQVFCNRSPTGGGEDPLPKLAKLLPGLDILKILNFNNSKSDIENIDNQQNIKGLKIILFEYATSYDEDELIEVPFCITGGADKEGNANKSFWNYAYNTNVQYFLRLQAYLWPLNRGGDYRDQITKPRAIGMADLHLLDEGKGDDIICEFAEDSMYGSDFSFQSYYLEDPVLNAADWAEYARSDEWKDKAAALQFLDTLGATTHLMPVYGIGDTNAVKLQPHDLLFSICAGVVITDLEKPVVIINFSEISDAPWVGFVKLLATEDDTTALDNLALFCRQHLIKSRIKVLHLKQGLSEIQSQVRALTRGEICVLDIGTVPQELFNYMYSRATLPPVFEGQGTAVLALNQGKPFFKFSKPGARIGYPDRFSLDSAVAQQCQKFANQILIKPNAWPKPADDIHPALLLSMFINAALAPSGEIKEYFDACRDYFHNERHDKLLMALQYFMEHFNPDRE